MEAWLKEKRQAKQAQAPIWGASGSGLKQLRAKQQKVKALADLLQAATEAEASYGPRTGETSTGEAGHQGTGTTWLRKGDAYCAL